MKLQLCDAKGLPYGIASLHGYERAPKLVEWDKRIFILTRCEAFQHVYYETLPAIFIAADAVNLQRSKDSN